MIILAAAAGAAAIAQAVIPELGERAIEGRLEAGGGSATVRLDALPAARLLFADGDRIEIDGRDLKLDLDEEAAVFDRLDGFGVVAISIEDSRAGPFALDAFRLSRAGDGPYRLVSTGTFSALGLAEYGFDRLGVPGAGIVGSAVEALLGEPGAAIPLELDMELISDDGRIRVVSGAGTVAGIPAGPLAEWITAAIVVRV